MNCYLISADSGQCSICVEPMLCWGMEQEIPLLSGPEGLYSD